MKPPPKNPPPLTMMSARIEQLEAERRRLFAVTKTALEEHDGNVTAAAAKLGWKRDRANRLVRRFGLVEYAAVLRAKKTGHARGRQDR